MSNPLAEYTATPGEVFIIQRNNGVTWWNGTGYVQPRFRIMRITGTVVG